MSDQLPSRDPRTKQGRSLAFDHAQFAALGNAWRSGRLIDREAIDMKVAIEAWWAEFATGGMYNPATRAAFAAAIGDTDE